MNAFRLQKKLMGTAFELILHHEDEHLANALLDAGVEEIQRIENLLSEFKPDSLISRLNQAAGVNTVDVGEEVSRLIERSIHISKLSHGAFDINMGALKQLYRFKNEQFTMPENDTIEKALMKTGSAHILREDGFRYGLKEKGMALSFAAIGKGYAADAVKALWISKGVTSGVISASGDMCTIGCSSTGNPWKVGIANPEQDSESIVYIPLRGESIATSGDYHQFFIYKGERYNHNINPQTGKPVQGITSVSVISPAAELSDALSTAVMVKGVEAGLHFINQLPQTHAVIIDADSRVYFSKNIKYYHENQVSVV